MGEVDFRLSSGLIMSLRDADKVGRLSRHLLLCISSRVSTEISKQAALKFHKFPGQPNQLCKLLNIYVLYVTLLRRNFYTCYFNFSLLTS